MPRLILIVEKDQSFRRMLCGFIEGTEYLKIEASTREAALSIIRSVWFGIIIVSTSDDDPGGERIAREPKAIQSHIKVILIGEFEESEGVPPHIDAFVSKPFSLSAINAAIQMVRKEDSEDFYYTTPRYQYRR